MPFCANTTEVSSRSNGNSPVARLGTPVAFKVLMTTSCATQRRRIVGCLHLGLELGVADPKRQAVGLDRFEMRSPHHAGDVVSGQRQPHRYVAADGARTENANTHEVEVLLKGSTCRGATFHKLAPQRNH